MRAIPRLLAATAVLALAAGCGGSPPKAAGPSSPAPPTPSPSPSASPDPWAVQTCQFLSDQDPANEYANSFAMTIAQQSTTAEFVALVSQAQQTGNSNLIREWCTKHVKGAGATQPLPKS